MKTAEWFAQYFTIAGVTYFINWLWPVRSSLDAALISWMLAAMIGIGMLFRAWRR